MKKKIWIKSKSFLICALLGAFQASCIEQKLGTDPDGQIVVVGNGAQGNTTWLKTLVVDIVPRKTNVIQSLIVEPSKMVTVQEKLQVPSPAETVEVGSSFQSSLRLGWIVSGENEGQVILKVSNENREAMGPKCFFYKAKGNQVESAHYDALQISDSMKPDFRADGSIYFVDRAGNLKVSFDQATSMLLAMSVTQFFLDASDSLFYKEKSGEWFFAPKESLEALKGTQDFSGILISNARVFYKSDSGNVFFHLANKGVGLSANLGINQLYKFDSVTQKFEATWPELAMGVEIPAEFGESAVQGESLFISMKIEGSSKSRVIELGPHGMKVLPSVPFTIARVIAGTKNIFVKADLKDQSRYIGQVCARNSTSGIAPHNFLCKTLVLPETEHAVESTLEGNQVVVALAKNLNSALSEFQVAALGSDLLSAGFGQIIKSWDVQEPIIELRFFDLTNSKKGSPEKLSQR